MKYYLAPMEGLTGYVYRNVYHSMFAPMDVYVTPFIAPNQKKLLRSRERKDVAVENNVGLYVVPQILTNDVEQFLDTSKYLYELGYKEVNLNLGCPSATVVTKKKGAGFLDDPKGLEQFWYTVFERLDLDIKISVKTRLGIEFESEFEDLIHVYNQFPFSEVMIHPRLQKDFYKGHPRMHIFKEAIAALKHPICYNGDLFTAEDVETFKAEYPNVDCIMLGRGVLANPGLVHELETGQRITKEALHQYHHALCEGYCAGKLADKDVLFKMKELWFYLGTMFENVEKPLKKVRKATTLDGYLISVDQLFEQCECKKKGGFSL